MQVSFEMDYGIVSPFLTQWKYEVLAVIIHYTKDEKIDGRHGTSLGFLIKRPFNT